MGKAEQIQQGQKIVRAGKMILLISLSVIALLVIACILFVAFYEQIHTSYDSSHAKRGRVNRFEKLLTQPLFYGQ